MKTNNALWMAGVFAAVFAGTCHAALNGSDDFNDNFKDPARWGPDFIIGGVGLLTETNGRLEFTTSAVPNNSTLVARPWILNYGSYTQNWEVQIDASVPHLGFPESLFGLGVAKGTNLDFSNIFSIDLFEPTPGGRVFLAKLRVNNGIDQDVADQTTSSTWAGLRIAFDAKTKRLSAYYDEDGPNSGYSWTLLGSTNISTAWSMTPTNVFAVWVAGRVQGPSVASTDNLFGDNFYAHTASPPSLGINLVGGNVVLSWSTNAPGYHLQSTTALTPPVDWQAVTNVPGIINTNFTVTNSVSSDKGFYRLSE